MHSRLSKQKRYEQILLSSRHGFTIVELLVVIVLIGILTAIVIVTYIGLQDRANNARVMVAVEHWEKSIATFKTVNRKLPEDWTCLGNSANDFQAVPAKSLGLGVCERGIVVNSAWSSEFKTTPILGQSQTTAQRLRANVNTPSGELAQFEANGGVIRGIIYAAIAGPSEAPEGIPRAFIIYALKNEKCTKGVLYKQVGNLNICALRLTKTGEAWIDIIDVYNP